MTTTHHAAEHACALADLSAANARIRELELALSDCSVCAIEASATLARCLCIADQPHRERVTGILARSIARARLVLGESTLTAGA